jgi:hypothetical protein
MDGNNALHRRSRRLDEPLRRNTMNANKFIAAAAVFIAAGSAFAADAPVAAAGAPIAAGATVLASNVNVPSVSISAGASRADVRAEAVEFVKNYKTAFAIQLEQYKN